MKRLHVHAAVEELAQAIRFCIVREQPHRHQGRLREVDSR
jgi:hypothetical protein